MHVIMKIIISLLIALNCTLAQAVPQSNAWFSQVNNDQVILHVDLFLSSQCIHCHNATVFFLKAQKKNPWLNINPHVIDQDRAALQLFYERLQQQGINNFAVPGIFFCDSHWVGFADEETTGKILLNALEYCHNQIIKQGGLSPDTIAVLKAKGRTSQFQINQEQLSYFPFLEIPLLAVMDAITPCSLFTFLAFWAFIWLTPDDKKKQLQSGFAFLITLAIIRLIEQVFTDSYFQLVSWLWWPSLIFGLCLFFYVGYYAFKTRFHADIQPVWLLPFVVLTAVLVQMHQENCMMNVGLLFEQWLESQSLTNIRLALNYGTYLIFYIAPLSTILLIYINISKYEVISNQFDFLFDVGLIYLSTIAAILIFYPVLLSSLTASYILLITGLLLAFVLAFLRKIYEKE